MNKTHPLILDLARPPISWTVITRDGLQAEILKFDAVGGYPLIGYIIRDGNNIPVAWTNKGECYGNAERAIDNIFLNTDTSNPDVQAAVQLAHAAGHEIWFHKKSASRPWQSILGLKPSWNWKIYDYLPAVLVTESEQEPAKPAWKLPEPPEGQKWHREDFTERDLPEGTRPLLMGEKVQKGDEHKAPDENFRFVSATVGWTARQGNITPHRTRRPLPTRPQIAPWTFEDVPMALKVKDTTTGKLILALATPDKINLYGQDSYTHIPYSAFVTPRYIQLDGSPCGKVVTK